MKTMNNKKADRLAFNQHNVDLFSSIFVCISEDLVPQYAETQTPQTSLKRNSWCNHVVNSLLAGHIHLLSIGRIAEQK